MRQGFCFQQVLRYRQRTSVRIATHIQQTESSNHLEKVGRIELVDTLKSIVKMGKHELHFRLQGLSDVTGAPDDRAVLLQVFYGRRVAQCVARAGRLVKADLAHLGQHHPFQKVTVLRNQ